MILKTAAPDRVCAGSVENIRMSKCRKGTGFVDGHSARLLALLWIADGGSVSAESNTRQVVCVVTEIMYEFLPEFRALLASGYRMLKRFSGTSLIHLSLSVSFFHLFSYPVGQLIHNYTSLISLQNAYWGRWTESACVLSSHLTLVASALRSHWQRSRCSQKDTVRTLPDASD